jgi:hypothetical protein
MRIAHPSLTFSILVFSALLAGFHWFATINFLYWHFVWLDTLSHFLGGTVVGLIVLRIFRTVRIRHSALMFFSFVLFVGIGWEAFEYIVGSQRETNYLFDTSVDVVMDILGGCFAWMLFGRTVEKEQ